MTQSCRHAQCTRFYWRCTVSTFFLQDLVNLFVLGPALDIILLRSGNMQSSFFSYQDNCIIGSFSELFGGFHIYQKST